MLSVAAMAGGQENYYLSLAAEDYYVNGGEPVGRWLGRGAEVLGLVGEVTKTALRNLFLGFAPDGSRPLVQQQRTPDRTRQPGWDLTFSAPKSVSVLWSQIGAPERRVIERAHFAAVEKALQWVAANATAVYWTPSNQDATAENGYQVGASGNQNDMSASKGPGERYEFPCNHRQTFDTTITIYGSNGQKVSKHVTFTDINWGTSSGDDED